MFATACGEQMTYDQVANQECMTVIRAFNEVMTELWTGHGETIERYADSASSIPNSTSNTPYMTYGQEDDEMMTTQERIQERFGNSTVFDESGSIREDLLSSGIEIPNKTSDIDCSIPGNENLPDCAMAEQVIP